MQKYAYFDYYYTQKRCSKNTFWTSFFLTENAQNHRNCSSKQSVASGQTTLNCLNRHKYYQNMANTNTFMEFPIFTKCTYVPCHWYNLPTVRDAITFNSKSTFLQGGHYLLRTISVRSSNTGTPYFYIAVLCSDVPSSELSEIYFKVSPISSANFKFISIRSVA